MVGHGYLRPGKCDPGSGTVWEITEDLFMISGERCGGRTEGRSRVAVAIAFSLVRAARL